MTLIEINPLDFHFLLKIIIAYFLLGNTYRYLKLRVIIVAFFHFIGIMLIFSNHNNLSAEYEYRNDHENE